MGVRAVVPSLLLSLLAGCTYASGDPLVFVTSTPPGAEIHVDGEPTGHTTPHRLEFGGVFGDDHQITLTLDGYEPETREVVHRRVGYTSRWIDGAGLRVVSAPLWWTLGDFFAPFAIRWTYVPGDLHVTLYPVGEAPVHGDAAPDRVAAGDAGAAPPQ